jgi:hypothetical protein
MKSHLAATSKSAFSSKPFISLLFPENNNTTINNNNNNSSSAEHESGSKDRETDRSKEREKSSSSDHKANSSSSPKRPTSRDFPPEREKGWSYPPGLDNIALATGAFWQNYSGEQQINLRKSFQPFHDMNSNSPHRAHSTTANNCCVKLNQL